VADEALIPLDRDLWVAPRPLPLWLGDVGTRMSVMRLRDGGLLLHSPVALDPPLREAVDRIGPVRFVVGPNRMHHFYLRDWAEAYPDALLWGAPGLPEKRRDLRFEGVLDDAAPGFAGEVETRLVEGAPALSEVAFLHRPTRTLLLADLAFNVTRGPRNRARLFHWLVGATGRFGPHRIARATIRDRRAARRSIDAILAWDFDRVVVPHGDVLETGGRTAMEAAFAFLG
jgi:hypothetical protein